MKSILNKFGFVPVLLLALTASLASAQEMSNHEHKLTNKEVKALIVNASTPADHLKLASYFRAEARDQESKAKYHEEMADLYKNNSLGKLDMANHCKHFAEEARKAAESDNLLAAEHEKMAGKAK